MGSRIPLPLILVAKSPFCCLCQNQDWASQCLQHRNWVAPQSCCGCTVVSHSSLSQRTSSSAVPQQQNKHTVRKAHQNCTNSLLTFKSLIKGGRITAINSGMFLGLVIAFELTLALDQRNLLFITHWWPDEMGSARWRRMGRSPDAVASMGVAEVSSGAGWRPSSQDGHRGLVSGCWWALQADQVPFARGSSMMWPSGCVPSRTSSSMCRAQPCRQLICTFFISKAQKCVEPKPFSTSSLVVLFEKQLHKMSPKANRIKLKERVRWYMLKFHDGRKL